MHYTVKQTDVSKQASDCLVVPVFSGKQLDSTLGRWDQAHDHHFEQLLKRGDLVEEVGETLLVLDPPNMLAKRLVLVFCGPMEDCSALSFREVIRKSATVLKSLNVKTAVYCLSDLNVGHKDYYWKLRQTIEVVEDVFYSFDAFKKEKKKLLPALKNVIFHAADRAQLQQGEVAIEHGTAITAGIKLTKDLGNSPANLCTPSYLAEQAQALSKTYQSIKTTVLEPPAIKKLGMGALLAVAKGSQEPAKLIIVKYQGAASNKKPVVLVGKGVTFDSGGLSLKSPVAMEEMKFDMCGAASVLGTIKAVAELKLSVNVVGVIPSTENLPSGLATKPGDIVTTLSGQTVEIMNTDAEGRLILCDALTYSERFKPEVVIDIATLTGAVIIALGEVATGLMSNNASLTQALLQAGEQSEDKVWELPLWEEYQPQINSNVADMSNVGLGGAKSITAGCFLSRFTKSFCWAHLDIAGTGWKTGKDKLATGRPVSLLVQYLLGFVESKK